MRKTFQTLAAAACVVAATAGCTPPVDDTKVGTPECKEILEQSEARAIQTMWHVDGLESMWKTRPSATADERDLATRARIDRNDTPTQAACRLIRGDETDHGCTSSPLIQTDIVCSAVESALDSDGLDLAPDKRQLLVQLDAYGVVAPCLAERKETALGAYMWKVHENENGLGSNKEYCGVANLARAWRHLSEKSPPAAPVNEAKLAADDCQQALHQLVGNRNRVRVLFRSIASGTYAVGDPRVQQMNQDLQTEARSLVTGVQARCGTTPRAIALYYDAKLTKMANR